MAPAVSQGPEVNLILTKQTPYPAEPGQVVSIEVRLQNNGSSSQSITLEVVPKEPFTLLPGEESVKTFPRIDAYDSATQTYRLKVSESALSATYELEFRYYREGASSAYVVKKIPVSVQGTPKIVIKDVQTTPDSMQPGDEVEITVTLKNEGTGHAAQTELSLVPEVDKTTGASIIAPVLSGGNFYLGEFQPGKEATAKFRLKIENTAEYKSYLSTLSINYKDETGTPGVVTFDMGLPVRGRPLLDILNAGIDNTDFKIDITNLGTASAKGIKISLIQGGKLEGVSVVSEIKAGKYKAVRFSEFGFGQGLLNISYYDESNNLHYSATDVYVAKPTGDQASAGSSPIVTIILVILVAVETFYIWRLRKRKK